jgi:hypothetical protein
MENCKFSANRKLLKLKTLVGRKIGELHQLANGVQDIVVRRRAGL